MTRDSPGTDAHIAFFCPASCCLFCCFYLLLLCASEWCLSVYFSKIKQLEEELHVVTASLRSLEISDSKVMGPLVLFDTIYL